MLCIIGPILLSILYQISLSFMMKLFKMNILSSLVLLWSLCGSAIAKPATTQVLGRADYTMMLACNSVLSARIKFGSNDTEYYAKLCDYPPRLASIFLCAEQKFGAYSTTFNKTVSTTLSNCNEYSEHTSTFDHFMDVYANGTNYAISYSKSTNYTATVLYQPIIIPESMSTPYYLYFRTLYYNYDIPSTFAGILCLYFVFVFILFGVSGLIKRLGFHRKLNNKVLNWYRANISIPSLFNGKHAESPVALKVISGLIPTRAESIVVFFFICLNVLLTAVNYNVDHTGVLKSKRLMLWEEIGDRTGLLSFGQIPLLIIFAGRNNILTTLTGIPYSTMIVYHKWVARAMWIHAFIHSVCWTGFAVDKGLMAVYYSEAYWIWGAVATVAGAFMLIQAVHFLRAASYETFLIVHIILAIIFIVGCWWHCYEIGWLEWIYVAWGVWIFDRLVRIVRMTIFGVQKAEVKFIGDDTFRVEVPYSKWLHPFPGSFAYLYFMTPTLFWQSHPFTLLESVQKEGHIRFFIKTKAGITKRIMKKLQDSPDGTNTISVCVEGNYGRRAPTDKYDKAILCAGGNGIPGVFSHAMDLSRRESSNKQEIKLIWSIRNVESFSWFAEELRAMAGQTNIQMDIYITGKNQGRLSTDIKLETTNSESSDNEKSIKILTPAEQEAEDLIRDLTGRATFHYQRPDIDQLILQEFTDDSGPSVCVLSCGPPKMVDQIRASVAGHLQKSKGRVDLFEELQVW